MDVLALPLLLAGLTLFVLGDLMWLVRNTFKQPMSMRVTGGLVGGGVLLIGAGLVVLVATA